MLKSLMDVSEAETGVMNLNIEEFNICLLIDDIIDLYAYLAEEKSISVSKNVPNALFVKADYPRIRQVVANLLDNAIKYTATGGKIAIQATANESEVKILFSDNGIGISDQDIDSIWKRLYRGDSSRSQEGHGLGLSLVKAIIYAHKGHVEVISQPGIGSDFSIYIPRL